MQDMGSYTWLGPAEHMFAVTQLLNATLQGQASWAQKRRSAADL